MIINEVEVTGKKFRQLIDEATKLWQKISFWTKSSDVEFDDGKNAETKVGAIDGITDSLVSTSSNIAASAKAVSIINNNLGGCSLEQIGSDFYIVGADTVRKKLGEFSMRHGIGEKVIFYNNTKKFLHLDELETGYEYTIVLSLYGATGVGSDILQNITFSGANVNEVISDTAINVTDGGFYSHGQIYIARITCTAEEIYITATYPYNRARSWIAYYVLF